MNRRSFLGNLSSFTTLTTTGGMLVSTSPLLFATEGVFNPSQAASPTANNLISHSLSTIDPGLSRRQWKTIISVQEHLFPSEEKVPSEEKTPSEEKGPGAKEVNSKAYLYAVLADPDRDNEDRVLVKEGVIELQDICWEKYKKYFIDCNDQQKEKSLRILEKTQMGTPWIMTLLGYIFEALLVDPIYGGNPQGIGWKWLEHNPGQPRPTADTRYFLLKESVL